MSKIKAILCLLAGILLSTAAFAAGPTITAIAVASVTPNSATITWTTNAAATSQIFYGVNGATNLSTDLFHALVTSHSLTLKNLSQQTVYTYEVQSTDSGGSTTSSSNTFALCNPGNPNSGFTNVTAGENAGYATGTVTATWTDNSGVSTSTPTVCGSTFATAPTAAVGLPGNLTMQLPDNNYIVPSPSSWIFTQSNASGLSANEVISGPSIDLTTVFGLQASPSSGSSGVTSFNTRTGAVTAQASDYSSFYVETVAVSLTAAQIIALHATPITAVAGVTGKYYSIQSATLEFLPGTVAFTGGGEVQVGLTNNASNQDNYPSIVFQTTIAGVTGASSDSVEDVLVLQPGTTPFARSLVTGQGIYITNPGTTWAAGNGTAVVTINYVVVTL